MKSEMKYLGPAPKGEWGHYRIKVECMAKEAGCRGIYEINKGALKTQKTCAPCCNARAKRAYKISDEDPEIDPEINKMANMKW